MQPLAPEHPERAARHRDMPRAPCPRLCWRKNHPWLGGTLQRLKLPHLDEHRRRQIGISVDPRHVPLVPIEGRKRDPPVLGTLECRVKPSGHTSARTGSIPRPRCDRSPGARRFPSAKTSAPAAWPKASSRDVWRCATWSTGRQWHATQDQAEAQGSQRLIEFLPPLLAHDSTQLGTAGAVPTKLPQRTHGGRMLPGCPKIGRCPGKPPSRPGLIGGCLCKHGVNPRIAPRAAGATCAGGRASHRIRRQVPGEIGCRGGNRTH